MQYRIKLSELNSNDNVLSLKLKDTFNHVVNSNIGIEEIIQNNVNDIIDYDKSKFVLINNLNLKIRLFNDTSQLTWENLYPTSSDITLDIVSNKNYFFKSFLKISFYDNPNPSQQKLLMQTIIYNQQPIVNNVTNLYDNVNVTYDINNPVIKRLYNEGYNLYWFSDERLQQYPMNLYAYFTFNNAKTGEVANFVPTNTTLTQNTLFDNNYVVYRLNNLSDKNIYSITNMVVNPLDDTEYLLDLYNLKLI